MSSLFPFILTLEFSLRSSQIPPPFSFILFAIEHSLSLFQFSLLSQNPLQHTLSISKPLTLQVFTSPTQSLFKLLSLSYLLCLVYLLPPCHTLLLTLPLSTLFIDLTLFFSPPLSLSFSLSIIASFPISILQFLPLSLYQFTPNCLTITHPLHLMLSSLFSKTLLPPHLPSLVGSSLSISRPLVPLSRFPSLILSHNLPLSLLKAIICPLKASNDDAFLDFYIKGRDHLEMTVEKCHVKMVIDALSHKNILENSSYVFISIVRPSL